MTIKTSRILILIVISTLAVPVAFADVSEATPFYDNMTQLLDRFYPEKLDEWKNNYDEHKDVHDDIGSTKEDIRDFFDVYKEETMEIINEKKETLKEAVTEGNMTPAEAREAFETFVAPYNEQKEVYHTMHEAFKTDLDLIKIELETNKANRIEIRERLREAITSGADIEVIKSIVDELIDFQYTHLDLDVSKLNLFSNYLSNL